MTRFARFPDRVAAGVELGRGLGHLAGRGDVLVLGLPRGGVPVAAEVARALRAPLDVFMVRKIGLPGRVELAVGALASGGVRVLNERVIQAAGIGVEELEGLAARAAEKLAEHERHYRGDRPAPAVGGRLVVVVDDGLATGATMRAAVSALRELGAGQVVAAVPVAPTETCARLSPLVDELVCLHTPEPFVAVGAWYEDFSPTADEEVQRLLATGPR
ncbi:MAG: putative phosphoribosyl transferase [Solirubrobacteraceae bacterium]|nr:putative phosphoribosyl transferase [Solirubrobacteraceae bacterium]